MNKIILHIPLLLMINACSMFPKAEISVSQHAKSTLVKQQKHRHKKIADGVISVDIINSNNRLHLLTGQIKHGKKTLWYQNSKTGGESWSASVKILNDDDLAVKMTRGNDAQITAQGDKVVVSWTKYEPNSRFKAGAMQAARSTDGGQSWQYSATPPDWKKGPHGYIDMAADKNAMHAVWLDSRSGHGDVKASQGLRYARSIDGGFSWQKNKTLDQLTCSCCWNTIKTDAEDKAYVLYRDKQPSDLSIGVIDQKQQWQRLNHVGAFNWQFDGCPHIGGGLDFQTTAGINRLHSVIGTGHPEHLGIHYLYSDDKGKNWSDAKQLGDESAIHADVAAHDNGRVVVVWDMMGEEGLAIFMAESKDQGVNWSDPKQISQLGSRATHPRIVKTEKGFLSLWTENNGHLQTLAIKRL
ncbi:MAG: exo-alpha-sialidase [Methylococcales bacterium]|nr:exo-alpha-sialidase [Methylococcales bacterium]